MMVVSLTTDDGSTRPARVHRFSMYQLPPTPERTAYDDNDKRFVARQYGFDLSRSIVRTRNCYEEVWLQWVEQPSDGQATAICGYARPRKTS